MKKILMTLLIILAAIPAAFAQNANRSGFFLELAGGGITGDSPAIGYSVANNTVNMECAGGAALNLGFGYRLATSRHWAYEFRAEGQTSAKKPDMSLVIKILPAGFRYTSSEIFGNSSIFAHLNVGGAIGAINASYTRTLGTASPNMETQYAKMFDKGSFGVAYEAGVGINITTHLYAEALWDSQVMLSTYGKNGNGTLHWGMAGVRIGYRF